MQIIKVSIDVKKLRKERFVQGKKGELFAHMILIPTPDNEFSDYLVVESVTKEERLAGKKGPILGNGNLPKGGKIPSRPSRQEEEDIGF